MSNARSPAVAGMFYPDDALVLADDVAKYMAEVPSAQDPEIGPKAIIAPHAGYVYSGAVAARAYAQFRAAADSIDRIILIGPAHRVAFRGIAAPTVDTFDTPLGGVPIDREAIAKIQDLPQVVLDDARHKDEHSLEVHIPFLQRILRKFTLVPLVAGSTNGAQVAQVLERLWGDDETRIVISTDLSHYQDYKTAQRMDGATAQAIETLEPAAIGRDQACGRIPVAGMLLAGRQRGMKVERLDLRNSGDTAGTKDKVVGYGSWCVKEGAGGQVAATVDDRALLQEQGARILRAAMQTVGYGIKNGKPPKLDLPSFPAELQDNRATFVTINKNGQLRGCIGTIQAYQPLITDLVENAFKAAMKDPRFPPTQEDEAGALEISVSLLSPMSEMTFSDEADLLSQLRPRQDGLIISDQGKRSVFLPQVWDSIPDAKSFLTRLKQKAGLAADHWSGDFQAWRFTALSVKPQASDKAK